MEPSSSSQKNLETQKTPSRPLFIHGQKFDDKPLWNHVKVLGMAACGGGNRTWSCNYCSKKVTGSYSKVKTHLLKLPNHGVQCCKIVNDDILREMKQEHEQAEFKKSKHEYNERQNAEYISLPDSSDLLQKKRKKAGELGPLEKSFDMAQRDVADKGAARMFYASALPFNFAKSPYFKQYSRTLANSNIAGYTHPSYNRLRNTLLAQENEHISRKLQPIRDSWRKREVSIVSDGWSDRQKRPLINIMAASAGGALFLHSIDATGNTKDGDYIATLFLNAIKKIGEANVVQIITDNAANCIAAGLIIETRFPHIFWTPCVAHSLNLALKSICDPSEKSPQYANCKCIADLVRDVQIVRNFIVNYGMALAIYNKYSKLSLLRVADTRFASSIIMTRRLREVKFALEKMVMDSD